MASMTDQGSWSRKIRSRARAYSFCKRGRRYLGLEPGGGCTQRPARARADHEPM